MLDRSKQSGRTTEESRDSWSTCLYARYMTHKVKYLTFGDYERSRSLTEILDAEYLVIGAK